MPEGDTLRRAAAALQPLVGHRVEASSPSSRGAATGVARAVDGRVLEDARAVGKHLLLRFDGGVLVHSHLRLSGRWRVLPPGAEVVGRPWLVLRTPAGVAVQVNGPVLGLGAGPVGRLGPDLLDADVVPAAVVPRLRGAEPGRLLGEVLQDQSLVAGIGNLWAAEGLWAARLHPALPIGHAGDDELAALLDWTRTAMLAAAAGGRRPRAVHGRVGRPCRRCGARIGVTRVGDANRAVPGCASCQRSAPL